MRKTPSAFRDPQEAQRLGLTGVSTGSFVIDHIIGNGGFPRTKISEVFGLPSGGKSTLAAAACAQAQRQGLYPVYVDVERGLDHVYATRLGFDVAAALSGQKGLYVTPETFEDMLMIVERMVLEGGADLIIVDSVPALVPKEMFDGDITELAKIGLQARIFANALPRLTKIIDRPHTKTALVFVNQIRAKFDAAWGSEKYKGAGGYALEHYSSLRLQLKQLQKAAKYREQPSLTDSNITDKIPTKGLHECLTFKNKVSAPYRKIKFYISYDGEQNLWGIDNLQSILDIALQKSCIETKGGGHYLYNGTETMQVRGDVALYDWFAARPAMVSELMGRLQLE